MQVGNAECLGTNLQPHSPPFSRLAGLGLYQLLEKPPVWESLSSANGRQTPRRVVEIAWKRLKRDPDSVVSLAFHCGWQIQEGTLLMKTLDANEDKQPHPKVQLAQALTWREKEGAYQKTYYNKTELCILFNQEKKKAIIIIIANSQKPF